MIITDNDWIEKDRKKNNYLIELSYCLKKQYKRIPFDYYFNLFDIADELCEEESE